MNRVPYSELRLNLKKHVDAVCDSGAPLLVKRRSGRSVVLMSAAEYNALEETLHLLSDPANAEHLRMSIAQAEAGQLIEHNIVE